MTHTQNTTALQPNAFLTGIHGLLSQTRDGRLFPGEGGRNAKVICKLHSQKQYLRQPYVVTF